MAVIPGTPIARELQGACACGGTMVYVEGSLREDDVSDAAVAFTRRCVSCGDEQESYAELDGPDPLAPAIPYVRAEPKVGRNEPCPCGSGKKHKRCCGAS